jgi:hypothetical protein
MNGTLIGIRMKINEKIDIYNYLNKEEYNWYYERNYNYS